MKFLRATGSTLALAMLAACSGGGNANLTPAKSPGQTVNPPTTSAKATRVKATILIPRSKKTSSKKSRKYISPSTEGLVIQVNQIDSSTGAPVVTTYSDTGYDLTSTASDTSCTQTNNGNQCTVYFNAPATSSTSSDAFYIYAYDAPQMAGAISTPYSPTGDLLSQDVGSAGTGDPVPSTSQSPANESNSGITANTNNSLTFILFPVVATVEASMGALEGGPLGSTTAPFVLSVPGTGGTSNAVTIDGYDGAGNEIMNYLFGSLGDDQYVNPISESLASSNAGTQFTFDGTNATGSLTSALTDTVTAVYTPAPGDAPSTSATTVPYGTASFSDKFSGGFYNTTTYPNTNPGPVETPIPVVIAPLYAFAPAQSTTNDEGQISTTVYAMQNQLPTGVTIHSYTLVPDTTFVAPSGGPPNDCTEYSIIPGPPELPTLNSPPTSIQATFMVTITGSFTAADTVNGEQSSCELTLSDGISSVPISLTQDDTPTSSHIVITTPRSNAQPVIQQGALINGDNSSSFSFPSSGATATVGDTLLCMESFQQQYVTFYNSNTANGAGSVITPSNNGYESGDSALEGPTNTTPQSNPGGYRGIYVALLDVQNSSDTISTDADHQTANGQYDSQPAQIWCGEYANTSASAIASQIDTTFNSDDGSMPASNTTPSLTPQYTGEGAITALGFTNNGDTFSLTPGYTSNTITNYSNSTASFLEVQSLTQVQSGAITAISNTISTSATDLFASQTILLPFGSAAHSSFATNAKHRGVHVLRVR